MYSLSPCGVFQAFRSRSWPERSAAISRLLLCLFFFDCAWAGGGHYFPNAPIQPRLLLGALILLTALPVLGRCLAKEHRMVVLSLGCFLAWMAVCALRGLRAGNSREVLLGDVRGFLWFFLLPVCAALLRTREQLRRVESCVLAGAFVQALLSLGCNYYCAIHPDAVEQAGAAVYGMFLGNVSGVSDSIVRIFFFSSPYLIAACAIALFRQVHTPRFRLSYTVLTAFYFTALLLTFTRSLYGATGIAAVLAVLLALIGNRKRLRRVCSHILVTAVLTLCLILSQEVLLQGSYLNFGLSRTLGTEVTVSKAYKARAVLASRYGITFDFLGGTSRSEDQLADEEDQQSDYLDVTEASDALRKETVRQLRQLIAKNPIFGNGLGASTEVRDNGFDEMFYLDVLCRMGIVGLLLYLAPLAWILLRFLRLEPGSRASCAEVLLPAYCGLAAFLFASAYNPWLNAVLGISWYALSAALPNLTHQSPEINL